MARRRSSLAWIRFRFGINQEVLDANARLEGKLSKGTRVRIVGYDQEAVVTGVDKVYVWFTINGSITKHYKMNIYMSGEMPPSIFAATLSGSLGMPSAIQAHPQSQIAFVSDPAIQKVFAKYDKDGSGQMEAKELRSCLRQLNVLVDDAEGGEVSRHPLPAPGRPSP